MNLSSVKGKSWILKKFNSTDINNYIETFSITEIVPVELLNLGISINLAIHFVSYVKKKII